MTTPPEVADYITPEVGQVWKHQDFAVHMKVLRVALPDEVLVANLATLEREGALPVEMHPIMLNKHYTLVSL